MTGGPWVLGFLLGVARTGRSIAFDDSTGFSQLAAIGDEFGCKARCAALLLRCTLWGDVCMEQEEYKTTETILEEEEEGRTATSPGEIENLICSLAYRYCLEHSMH